MQRVDVIAGVAEFQPVAAPLVHRVHRLHGLHREGLAVEGPLIEAAERGVALDDRHLDRLVGWGWFSVRLAELSVIPTEGLRRHPLWVPRLSGVFNDDTHTVAAIVIGEIAQYPHAGLLH